MSGQSGNHALGRLLGLMIAAAVASGAAVGGYALIQGLGAERPDGEQQSLVTVTQIYGDAQVSMTLQGTSYSLGEAIDITVSMKNTGSESIALYKSDGEPVYRLYVYGRAIPPSSVGSAEDLVWQSDYGRVYAQVVVTLPDLQPGEARSGSLSWPQIDNTGSMIEAGTYYLYGRALRYAVGPIELTVTGS